VARTTLERAQQAYDEGDYAKAINTLKSGGVSVFDGAEPPRGSSAMKLEAFSYCVANQIPNAARSSARSSMHSPTSTSAWPSASTRCGAPPSRPPGELKR
jgi:hypothetical protein